MVIFKSYHAFKQSLLDAKELAAVKQSVLPDAGYICIGTNSAALVCKVVRQKNGKVHVTHCKPIQLGKEQRHDQAQQY